MKEKKAEELLNPNKEQPIKPAKKANSWRVKHERLINMIRAAREPNKKKSNSTSTSSSNKNKKEKKDSSSKSSSLANQKSDSISQEIDIYEDYVTCPTCNRRFDAQVAERHMPKCKEIKARSLLHQLNNKSSAKVEAEDFLKKRMSYKPPALKSKKKGKAESK
ncbi:hypothetical protein H8356DRAFT_923621 [Neocallimastix lanati (nom. inval.)]|uniref:C2HC/C3H-type domain-containing protein n=1 Tax=Neocallimastix californiae TaxID=1754190 RepID=A0A1Y2ETE1_9FUNG|nr:hypothetical protein H8356DRAFT_923621 [Neocallimastix sp. JGI-2020a]ORY74436.1 hypothetical protein LY90DRAFT_152820 [Neocallimastix californiae]|eukprot:ORY74436.1 hypothetical protein LY90DRAFT_152820 [Neocallimastix californiae]